VTINVNPMPQQMPLANFSRRASIGVRNALAVALGRLVQGLTFPGSQAQSFAEVHDEWPSFLETGVFPAACILPGEFRYADSQLTPRLLEDTWEPKGMPGWGLQKTAELQTEFQLVIRTNLPGERPQLMQAIEDLFQPVDNRMDQEGPRYGLVVPLPEYYDLKGRFALLSGAVIDNEDTAMREKRDAAFTISASAPKVQVVPVWPMAVGVVTKLFGPIGKPPTTEVTVSP
jgi:hypothetical protein